jgi:hypothetical protein
MPRDRCPDSYRQGRTHPPGISKQYVVIEQPESTRNRLHFSPGKRMYLMISLRPIAVDLPTCFGRHDAHRIGIAEQVRPISIDHYFFKHREQQPSTSRDERGNGRKIPITVFFNKKKVVFKMLILRKNFYSGLLSHRFRINFDEQTIATCIREHLQEGAPLSSAEAVVRDRLVLAGRVSTRERQEADVRWARKVWPRSAVGEVRELALPTSSGPSPALRQCRFKTVSDPSDFQIAATQRLS